MKKGVLALFCLFILLCAFGISTAETDRNITIMIYMCGSDLESRNGSATDDIQEITEACSGNASVSVLILAGGTGKWKNHQYDPGEITLIEVSSRGTRVINRSPAANMGEPETLSSFLKFGVEQRPASRYALILWDHGGGPLEGVCYDELNGSDSLSLSELGEALKDSPFSAENHLSWIGFDACLMASIETAECCKDYADYMVASQETEPKSGWNYSFLGKIQEQSSGLEVCRNIVSDYPIGKAETDMLTLSLIDLSETDALSRAMDQLFRNINPGLTSRSFSDFSRLMLNTKSFGRASTGSEYDLADLFSLAEQLAKSDELDSEGRKSARALQTTLLTAVKQTSGNQENAFGLSVYSPYYNKENYLKKWSGIYQTLGPGASYMEFLSRFSFFWNSKQMAVWEKLTGSSRLPAEQGPAQIELRLSGNQADNFASASCLILEDDGSENYYCSTYLVDDVQLDGNNLKAEYAFDALYAVDGNGIVETNAIPFEIRDGYYLVSATLQKHSLLHYFNHEADPDHEELQVVLLQCRKNPETDELEICNILPVGTDHDELNLGRLTIDLDPETWPFIRFSGTSREKTTNLSGSLLPFPDWKDSGLRNFDHSAVAQDGSLTNLYDWHNLFGDTVPAGYHATSEADNTRPWKLKLIRRKATGRELAAQFIIRDTQGNIWGSDLIPVQNPDIRSRAEVLCDPLDLYGCTVQPFEAKTIVSDSFQGVCIRIRFKRGADPESNLIMVDPIINNINFGRAFLVSSRGAYEEEEECIEDFYIGLDHLPFSDDPVIRTISCILSLPGHDHQQELFYERTILETSLDVSMLTLPDRPEETIPGHVEEGVEIRLLGLEEAEDPFLKGRLHMINHGTDPKWVMLNSLRDDTEPAFYFNEYAARNSVVGQAETFLLPGGEAYLDFGVYYDPNCGVSALGYGADAWEANVDSIHRCGFSVRLVNRGDVYRKEDGSLAYTVRIMEIDGKMCLVEGGMSYGYWFMLPEPLQLKTPVNIKYTPEIPSNR